MKAKVIMDKKTKKSKGYGFVSFSDPNDYLKAMKELQGQYVGNRPIKLRKSRWKDRIDFEKMENEQMEIAKHSKKQKPKQKSNKIK